MILIIVESPSKTKKVKQYAEAVLNKTVVAMASIGHPGNIARAITLDDIKKFEFPYEINKAKLPNMKKIIDFAKKSELIYLATDEDREGEGIAYRVYLELLKARVNKNKIKRVIFHEITAKGIKEGLNNARELDFNLINAQVCRSCLDQVVGFALSKKLMNSSNQILSPKL